MKQSAGSLKRLVKLANSNNTYKEERDKTQVTNIRNQMNIIADPSEIKRVVRKY